MALRLGDIVPDFTRASTDGPIHFHDWAAGSWVVLFSHPKDYKPVCTTEPGAVAKLKPRFDQRNVKMVGLSVDGLENHGGCAATSRRRRALFPGGWDEQEPYLRVVKPPA